MEASGVLDHALLPGIRVLCDEHFVALDAVADTPGKVVREISDSQARVIAGGALHYVENWKRYRASLSQTA